MLPQWLPQVLAHFDLTFWSRCGLKIFNKGHHFEYQNGTILAILNLCHIDASHQVLAQSDLQFRRRCHLKNFKMPPWKPSWMSEQNDFSNSESLCHSDASHQVSAQSNLQFWRRFGLNGTTLAILNLYVTSMPQVLAQSDLQSEMMWFEEFQNGLWQPSWISEQNDFSNSKSSCCHNASHQVSAQSHLRYWRCWKCEKLTTDRQMTDNRPQHKLTWSKAVELRK